MKLRIISVSPAESPFFDLDALEALYLRSFPENERRPLSELMSDTTGTIEVLAFYEKDRFCGMACLLNTEKISHIIYLAIEEKLRGRGLGSMALKAIQERKPGRRILVDVERVEEQAPNNEQRRRRIAFYEKNGYRETDVHYRWRDEDYSILAYGGNVTEEDWYHFWAELEKSVDTQRL